MKAVLSTRNKNKIRELNELFRSSSLDGIEILSLEDVGITEEVEEIGSTFEENSLIKASLPAKYGYIGIADDSGLCVDALNGAPGLYSSRFSGLEATDKTNNALLLSKLESVPDNERSARFVCVISCVFPDGYNSNSLNLGEHDFTDRFPAVTGSSAALTVRGECEGVILRSPRGFDGFGYDPLFYIPEIGKTFAELSSTQKSKISHRGRALRSFTEVFGRALRSIE